MNYNKITRWCTYDVRDFLKDELGWKFGEIKKKNSCVSIESSPTNLGQTLLGTENCDRKLPFICEVRLVFYLFQNYK